LLLPSAPTVLPIINRFSQTSFPQNLVHISDIETGRHELFYHRVGILTLEA